MTTYTEWQTEFEKVCNEWVAKNAPRIKGLTMEQISEIGDELQADAFSNLGNHRLDLTEWEFHDASCSDRQDFQMEVYEYMEAYEYED